MKKAVRSPKCSQQSMKVVQGLGASNLYGIDYEKGSLWAWSDGQSYGQQKWWWWTWTGM